MNDEKFEPKPGFVVIVPSIPQCNFNCEKPGIFDFPTIYGSWANGCEGHFKRYGASHGELGLAKGQRWITIDQVEYSDPVKQAKHEARMEREAARESFKNQGFS